MNKIFLALCIGCFSLGAAAVPSQTYYQLALKDLDQMTVIVKKQVDLSRKGSDKTGPLREGLQLVLTRPNTDGMIDKVLGPLRGELEEHEAWEKTVHELVDEAIQTLKESKDVKAADQVGYVVFLQNLIAEIKPRGQEEGFERDVLKKIAEADLKLSKEARNELRVRSMKEVVSPSKLAEAVLAPPKTKKEK